MRRTNNALRLRVYLGEADEMEGRPAWEAVIQAARDKGLAGATVYRGLAGYGAHSLVHTATVLRLAEDLPLVVELADEAANVEAFVHWLEARLTEGAYTLEPVELVLFRD